MPLTQVHRRLLREFFVLYLTNAALIAAVQLLLG